jgi:hypothetical protein
MPHVWLVQLTDPALFECPFLMASDVGTIGLSEEEVDRLRQYLQKGGFLWVDDFWGEAAWQQWSRELARAMPAGEYVVEDVRLSDPIFRSMFEVRKVPQVAGIGFWRRFGEARRPNAAKSRRSHTSARFGTRRAASWSR